MKLHKDIEQKSEAWFELRRQHPLTASNATAIITAGVGLESLCWTAIAERRSSKVVEHYSNKDTERGIELEPQAITIYELETGSEVEEVGFITNNKISDVGGVSPDGIISKDGMVEVKCPDDVKFLKLLAEFNETGKITIEKGYYRQMQMQMMFAERKWNDYVVFNPNFSPNIIIQRVEPDKEVVEKLKIGLAVGEQIIIKIEKKLCLKK